MQHMQIINSAMITFDCRNEDCSYVVFIDSCEFLYYVLKLAGR